MRIESGVPCPIPVRAREPNRSILRDTTFFFFCLYVDEKHDENKEKNNSAQVEKRHNFHNEMKINERKGKKKNNDTRELNHVKYVFFMYAK